MEQIEVHPYFQQRDVQGINAAHGILTQAWSPIGGITFYRGTGRSTLDDPVILSIAKAHGKSAAQIMLGWHVQERRGIIPKSVKPARIAENLDIFDFALTEAEMTAINGLETGQSGGPVPDDVTLETFGRDIPEA
ncbi:aldo/keto reductase [Donghicola mangrovi]|uniref:aldo/keto reductase n=1 Tax=Donghicola mangrovi TaxID=2729614 RepID=UPI0030B83927